MNNLAKRSLSLLLAVVMCVSLLSGLVFTSSAATVSYKTGDAEGFEDVIMNWGQRGTTATYLSPNAEAFYSKNGTSYSELAQLSGSSEFESVASSKLYLELNELMASNHTTITSYGDTRDLYRFTDCQNSDNTSISSFYSGVAIGPKWDAGATWNREHTWPQSKGLDGADEDDIMILRPTAGSENSARGNKAYGESEGFYDPNLLSDGKLNNRGDVARIMLYIYVRWGNTNLFGSEGAIESLDLLLRWVEEDPVDTWELGRNDVVESITGTRNVFVDYPELVYVLFDADIPASMTTPSGEAYNAGNTYDITASVNDAKFGAVSVSGNNVNAFPAEGYIVSGYTLVSGTADVVRNGNVFAVKASSDCEIRINFEERNIATVNFSEDGFAVSSKDAFINDSIILPGHSGAVADGYSFIGWVSATVEDTTAAPAAIYHAGASYIVTGDVTLYALYSRTDSNSSGQSSVFNFYEGQPVEGDYLIVSDGGAMKSSITKNRFDYLDVTITNDSIMNPDAAIIWHIAPAANGTYTIYNKSGFVYAGGSGVKNQGKLLSEVNDFAKWSISEDQVFENVGNQAKKVNYTLRRNATYGFACYGASTGTGMTLYKMVTGTVYYSTSTGNACQHVNTQEVAAVEPGCTTVGYTAGVICVGCQTYLSGHEEIAASGHKYDSVVTEPTVTEKGYTTYTCSVCGDSYVSDYTEALGQVFKVSFSVPAGVTAIETMDCGKNGIKLPTAAAPSGEYEYIFLGWVAEEINNSEVKPTLYLADSTYKASADITLHALYSYAPEGMGSGAWELVTDASQLTAGVELVLVNNVKNAVAGVISSQYMTSASVEFSEDLSVITNLPADAVILTLGGSKDAWTLADASGKLLGATAVKKMAWDKGDTTWIISIDAEFNATIQNGTEAYGRFLYNANNPRFTTYTSDPNTSMLMPQLYKLDGAVGTVYYTTVIESGEVETGVTVSGTITSAGADSDEITVELLKDGEVVYSVTGGAAYSIENVVPGEYTLRITKANHVAVEQAVTVGSDAVVLDAQICLVGDVNCDGKVNMKDWSRLYDYIGETIVLDEYNLACADADGNGKVNMKDWSRLYDHISEIAPLW